MKKNNSINFILLLLALSITFSQSNRIFTIESYSDVNIASNLPYWYTFNEYMNPTGNSDWIPFFSLTDVPESLPLRGFNSNSRSMFLDLGTFEWFSDWVENLWFEPTHNCETDFDAVLSLSYQSNCTEFFFNLMEQRLTTSLYLDYVKKLKTFNVWTPIIVYDNMTAQGYETSNIQEWIINNSNIATTLNNAFPILNFTSSKIILNSTNLTAISTIIDNHLIYIDEILLSVDNQFLSEIDTEINNVLINYPSPPQYDVIFPSLLFLQSDLTLYLPGFGKIGGLGQLDSKFPDIGSFTIQGRNQYSYFYGGDPEQPRANLESTVIHELGHTLGLPHPHSFGYYILDLITESAMTYYTNSIKFDHLDTDLILNGISLQLLGKYRDEASYFRSQSLNSTQNALITSIEEILNKSFKIIYDGNFSQLREHFIQIEEDFNSLGVIFGRKNDNWNVYSDPLKIQIDFIIGQGFLDNYLLAQQLMSSFTNNYEISITSLTTLPEPRYNITSSIVATNTSYQSLLKNSFKNLLEPANTSDYDPSKISSDAWNKYPRNKIFSVKEGFLIDAYEAEEWLETHPATLSLDDSIHYRFYIFNLADITKTTEESSTSISSAISSSKSTPSSYSSLGWKFELIISLFFIAYFLNLRKKKKK